jgi:hypothetical protein
MQGALIGEAAGVAVADKSGGTGPAHRWWLPSRSELAAGVPLAGVVALWGLRHWVMPEAPFWKWVVLGLVTIAIGLGCFLALPATFRKGRAQAWRWGFVAGVFGISCAWGACVIDSAPHKTAIAPTPVASDAPLVSVHFSPIFVVGPGEASPGAIAPASRVVLPGGGTCQAADASPCSESPGTGKGSNTTAPAKPHKDGRHK